MPITEQQEVYKGISIKFCPAENKPFVIAFENGRKWFATMADAMKSIEDIERKDGIAAIKFTEVTPEYVAEIIKAKQAE